ncbi:MAG TPA: acetyl-CoA acetyltransferase [Acidimicrobiia bacterium]|nr:acetyl-CoA acetyltransferase [Acidimicrobiia bacterium]
MPNPRTAVIVGVGQAEQRVDDPAAAREPIDLLGDAVRAAETDTGAAVLARVDTVAVVSIVSWAYPDPGALLARRLGLPTPRRTMTTTVGGNSPQLLVNILVPAIERGDADVVLLGGAECVHTRWRARREPKAWLTWPQADDPPCADVVGDDRAGSSDYELAHGAAAPTLVYPLFETALRAAAGRTVDEHQVAVSELWSGFSAVAAENPHAWSRQAFTPAALRTPTPDNRMITFPYLKRLCANIDVDQAAALLLCSYETARDAGVPEDRMVFPRSGADAHDHFFVTERDRLDTSPALRAVGEATLAAAGATVDDVARFDLYSCFPSAVQVALGALGLRGPAGGDHRPLTVTGGLGFAGGPANNYPTHAIAAMVDACRQDPGSLGFVSAIGWYITKHAAGCYSTTPPPDRFGRVDPAETQQAVDALPRRAVAGAYAGPGTVEATAVVVERDGTPSLGIVSVRTPDGSRALANSRDAATLRDMIDAAWEGRAVRLVAEDASNRLA